MITFDRTWAEINIEKLIDNISIIKKTSANNAMAVVKADSYGCGALPVSAVCQKMGIKWFGVSNIDEAMQLRDGGINENILILGYTPPHFAPVLSRHNISQAVFSLEYANKLAEYADGRINIHIKLDTGMSRIGFDCRSDNLNGLPDVLEALKCGAFNFEGVFTHFATADGDTASDVEFTRRQYELFSMAIDRIKARGFSPKVVHCCNSAATFKYPEMHNDLCRVGISYYCNCPGFARDIKDIITFKSVVSLVKPLSATNTVGYGRAYKAETAITAATVSCGYADGLYRALSNKGEIYVNGKPAKIIGNICMDQFMIDVTNCGTVKPGDNVTIYGDKLKISDVATLCNTIPYELICNISKRVPRVYIYKGQRYTAKEIVSIFTGT